MRDVQQVVVYLRHPTSSEDLGQVTYGFYKVDDGTLIMTDQEGRPVRKNNGELWSHKLGPDDKPRSVAGRLTKEIRRELDPSADFNALINYPDIKKVVPV
jgi:hypothetical protein